MIRLGIPLLKSAYRILCLYSRRMGKAFITFYKGNEKGSKEIRRFSKRIRINLKFSRNSALCNS
ncbi:hypothetical protein [Saccharolobus caldissimus]|uniref:hypothetical protein n=1 Tax=Saccharolobus caldissimus TaxID=1702097 RepID=UPI001E2EFBCF|nr:hypothetical protein [Saccharolobus caldissimus]